MTKIDKASHQQCLQATLASLRRLVDSRYERLWNKIVFLINKKKRGRQLIILLWEKDS